MNMGIYIAAGIAFILAAIILYAFVDRICTCIERRCFIDRLLHDKDLNAILEMEDEK